MAGWIKIEKDLYTDPRIRRLARRIREIPEYANLPPESLFPMAFGAVSILWITADTHVGEDDVLSMGPHDIDDLVGITGFCELLPSDWLVVLDSNSVKLPAFHAHNGTSARKRAVNNARVARWREAKALRQRNRL